MRLTKISDNIVVDIDDIQYAYWNAKKQETIVKFKSGNGTFSLT